MPRGADARELLARGPVLDHHRDVLELGRERVGDLVERVADHAFELGARHVDHGCENVSAPRAKFLLHSRTRASVCCEGR